MRTKKGTITSAKMTDTVTVTVTRAVYHPLYKKRYTQSKKFLADSKGMDLGVGDLVVITECRPLSKRKHFRVTEVLKSAPRVSEMVEEEGLTGVMERNQKSQTNQRKQKKEGGSASSSLQKQSPESPSSESSASSDSSDSSRP